VTRDDEIVDVDRHVVGASRIEGDASGKTRPGLDQHPRNRRGGRRRRGIDDDRVWRRVVEQQHHVREQAVAAAEIDDASTPEAAPDAPSGFPRFIQLLARKASG